MALGLVFGILILWLGIFAGVIFLCGFGLYRMAQHAGIPSPWLAFLPVARQQGGETPIYLEEADYTPAECGEALAWLQLKGLVSLDYDLPLKNFDYAAYGEKLLCGSAALTAAGQEAVEVLELQGAGE